MRLTRIRPLHSGASRYVQFLSVLLVVPERFQPVPVSKAKSRSVAPVTARIYHC